MTPRPTRPCEPTLAEAIVWADVLVRRLVQHRPGGPVRVLAGPAEILELAAAIQHRIRSTRTEHR
ncbi:hypothetical protein [Streptomyces sp. NPDC007070]|uniref:hypothetical protein n=1 Tax=Streptomyces sp. NPDC007070 TaxID=3154312 RepID=UPI0033CA779C